MDMLKLKSLNLGSKIFKDLVSRHKLVISASWKGFKIVKRGNHEGLIFTLFHLFWNRVNKRMNHHMGIFHQCRDKHARTAQHSLQFQ